MLGLHVFRFSPGLSSFLLYWFPVVFHRFYEGLDAFVLVSFGFLAISCFWAWFSWLCLSESPLHFYWNAVDSSNISRGDSF